jgi:hypothetical protein
MEPQSHPTSTTTTHSFEEAYLLEHGRFPRGAEKAPLASTYAQHRAWKRLIRIDIARYVFFFLLSARMSSHFRLVLCVYVRVSSASIPIRS